MQVLFLIAISNFNIMDRLNPVGLNVCVKNNSISNIRVVVAIMILEHHYCYSGIGGGCSGCCCCPRNIVVFPSRPVIKLTTASSS